MSGGVFTINWNVRVVVAPQLSVAVTVTVYVPDGLALLTETTPVVVLPENVPVNVAGSATAVNVTIEPLSVGAALGVTVKLEF